MLEGLEISVQYYKSLSTIIDYRIEAEYFDKRFLKIDDIFERIENTTFFSVANYENGRAYNSEEFSVLQLENGVKVSKIGDVTQKRINVNWVEVSELEFLRQKGNCLIDDDILMTLTGDPPDVGKVNLFKDNQIKSTWNQRVARVYLQENQSIFYSSKVFFIVLYNRFCREQLERFAKGIRQRNLGVECIEKLRLPILSITLQVKLNELITESFSLLEAANSTYKSSETLLLGTLGLNNFEPTSEPVNVKCFKESFLSTGRLDAEYYQKKYEDYEKVIKFGGLGFTSITNEYTLIKNVSRKDKESYNYIEIGDVNVSDGSATYNFLNSSELPANAKTEVERGDILISKVRSNRGAVTIIDFDAENLIVSGAFTVLREKENSVFSNETLKVLLRTSVYKDWLLQFNIGTQYPVIRDEDILKMPIPKIPKEIQEEITQKIQISQSLKKQSEQLLETAKRAVEIAIEEGEEMAMEYIRGYK